MHSFILSQLDLPDSPDTLKIIPETSIGIDEVKTLKNFLTRKPIQSPHNTVVIYSAHKLTLPAQNAILKSLEEPPGNSKIYLVTSQPDLLLPTILSRCQITTTFSTVNTRQKDFSDIINKLVNSTALSDRIKLLETQKFTRDSAIELLNSFEAYLHHQAIRGNLIQNHSTFKIISQCRRRLVANCSVKLTLINLAFEI